MSNDTVGGGEQDPHQAAETPLSSLTSELIVASGHHGLHTADRLRNANTLLGLSAVRELANRKGISPSEAALRIVRETVDTWSDERGRAILRSAFAFDYGSLGSRPNRLGRLAMDLGEASGAVGAHPSVFLDTEFTERLAGDLAAELLTGKPRVSPKRRLLIVGVAITLVVLLGIGTLLLLRDEELVFRPLPSRCPIDYCRHELQAVEAKTGGFTPDGIALVEIFTPSGTNANDLPGLYTYNSELPINKDGQFIWRYWWDPGMELGVYHVRITDEKTGRSIEADFEFY